MRVVLVNPPVSDVQRPSIGLSILQRILADDGHAVSVAYANIWFADAVGLDTIHMLSTRAAYEGLGEWIFGRAAFPGFDTDEAAYLQLILARERGLGGKTPDAWMARLLAMRREMVAHVAEAVDRILAMRPDVVGCSSTFTQHVPSLAILRRIKEVAPHVVTVMGGANCESVMGRTTHQHFRAVDYVVSGEAEELVASLFNVIATYGADAPLETVPFAVFAPVHRSCGYPSADTTDGLPRAIVQDMTVVPAPDYDDYFPAVQASALRDYVKPGLLMETSRGCWFGAKSHCTFCGLNGHSMAFRSKPADMVLREIDALTTRYGVHGISVVDNILDMKFFDDLLPALAARETPPSLFYETKSNLKATQLRALSAAGVRWIQPGVESLDSRVLKLIRKGVSAIQNIALLKNCRQYGIYVYWNLMFGFPGEDDRWYQDMAEIAPLLTHLQPGNPIGLLYARFSPYHRNAESYGLRLKPGRYYKYIYPLAEADLSDLVYFFDDANSVPEAAETFPPRERPGLRNALAALDQWHEAWRTAPRPICTVRKIGNDYVLRDTRQCAVRAEAMLEEVELSTLLAADGHRTPDQVVTLIAEELQVSPQDADAAFKALEADKLILVLDGRALGLVLFGAAPRLPPLDAVPGGWLSDQPFEPAL